MDDLDLDVTPAALAGDELLMWTRAVNVARDGRCTVAERALAFDVIQLLERVSATRAVINPPLSPDNFGNWPAREASSDA